MSSPISQVGTSEVPAPQHDPTHLDDQTTNPHNVGDNTTSMSSDPAEELPDADNEDEIISISSYDSEGLEKMIENDEYWEDILLLHGVRHSGRPGADNPFEDRRWDRALDRLMELRLLASLPDGTELMWPPSFFTERPTSQKTWILDSPPGVVHDLRHGNDFIVRKEGEPSTEAVTRRSRAALEPMTSQERLRYCETFNVPRHLFDGKQIRLLRHRVRPLHDIQLDTRSLNGIQYPEPKPFGEYILRPEELYKLCRASSDLDWRYYFVIVYPNGAVCLSNVTQHGARDVKLFRWRRQHHDVVWSYYAFSNAQVGSILDLHTDLQRAFAIQNIAASRAAFLEAHRQKEDSEADDSEETSEEGDSEEEDSEEEAAEDEEDEDEEDEDEEDEDEEDEDEDDDE